MIKLGITGGIASGKTTAAKYFENKKAYIFNADKESKKHLKKSLALQKKIINVFGKKIVNNHKIDLKLLAEVAFKNNTNHSIINGIMWPEIFLLINKEYDEIKKNNHHNIFIVDAALIFEAKFTSFFDKTILITASEKIRLERAVKRRNISLENIQNRISLQMSEKDKKNIADYTINNNYSKKNLYKKLNEIIFDLNLSE